MHVEAKGTVDINFISKVPHNDVDDYIKELEEYLLTSLENFNAEFTLDCDTEPLQIVDLEIIEIDI